MFFTDARTDADLVVGAPGDGWRVAMGTLMYERGVSTLGQQIRYSRELSGLVELAKNTDAIEDPWIRERLTRAWAGLQTMRSFALATMDDEQPGQDNGSKLLWVSLSVITSYSIHYTKLYEFILSELILIIAMPCYKTDQRRSKQS